MSQAPEKPIQEFRSGGISAAIWRKEVEQTGRASVTWSVRVQKRFRDVRTREWKDTDYFFPSDLPRLRLVVDKAFEFVSLAESDDAESPPSAE